MWFFIGGLIISVFLLIFFIIDIVYGYRIYNNFTISSGEATFLIIVNILGLLIVFSMIFMFFFQLFTRSKMATGGSHTSHLVNDFLDSSMGEKIKTKVKQCMPSQNCNPCNNGLCGNGCGSQTKRCYEPPCSTC